MKYCLILHSNIDTWDYTNMAILCCWRDDLLTLRPSWLFLKYKIATPFFLKQSFSGFIHSMIFLFLFPSWGIEQHINLTIFHRLFSLNFSRYPSTFIAFYHPYFACRLSDMIIALGVFLYKIYWSLILMNWKERKKKRFIDGTLDNLILSEPILYKLCFLLLFVIFYYQIDIFASVNFLKCDIYRTFIFFLSVCHFRMLINL